MKSHWITHKGKQILLADYSNFGMNAPALQQEMEDAIALAQAEPLNSVLTLTDVRGTRGSPVTFNLMKNTAARIAPHARKRAVVGVTGIQRTFMDMINKLSDNKTFTLFDDLEIAKDWLVSEP